MVDRRNFLTLALGTAAAATLAPNTARAGLACYPVHSAKSRCVAGLTGTPSIADQPCRSLTWATCLGYILSGYGANIHPRAILDRYKTDDRCETDTADSPARLMAAAGIWRDKYGRRFAVQTERLPDFAAGYLPMDKARRIITRLSRQPLLCGAAGHTTLLTEFAYDDSSITKLKITQAQVRDPWTETENLRALSPRELETPSYLVALSIRPL